MSSLQRSRSLRKPTGSISTASVPPKDVQPDLRKISPSRLPIKPTASAAAVSTATTQSSAAASKSARQPSAGLRRSTSLKASASASAQEPSKKDVSRYPPLSSANRPPVTGTRSRPTSSGGTSASQKSRDTAHARSKSNITTLNSATVLRPPSRDRTRSNATGATRSSHSRNASVDKSASTSPTETSAPSQTKVKGAATAPTQGQLRHRPAFSTLQQHYSPAKSGAPKPLTSTILAPPSPSKLPANVAASVEMNRLQAELLQLHLMHRDAASVHTQWQTSAQERLGEQFEAVSQASKGVAERERAGLENRNLLALKSWGGRAGLEEKVQSLEQVITGLWALSDPGGRYARVTRRFERWIDGVCEIEDTRASAEAGSPMVQGLDSLFISELDATWKDECAGLTRRLEGWSKQLRDIEYLPDQDGADSSSLEQMLAGSRSLLDDMLAELVIMEQLENDAVAREELWIEKMNCFDEEQDTQSAGAVWRTL